jgi:hypothetical protein
LWLLKERIAPLNATVLFSTTVSGVLDFLFGSASAWLALIAVLLLMLLLFLVCAPHMPAALRPALLQRQDGRLAQRAAVLYLGAAAAIFAGAAFASEKQRGHGGVVASVFPPAAALQRELNLLHQDNEQILGKLGTLKKETSDNPRKELFNQGMAWTNSAFGEVLRAGDVAAAALYLQGGMPIQESEASMVFNHGQPALHMLMAAHGELFDAQRCRGVLASLDMDAVLSATPARRAMLAALCGNSAGRAASAERLVAARSFLASAQAEQAKLKEWQAHPESCVAAVVARKGPRLSMRTEMDLFTYSQDAPAAWRRVALARCAALDSDLEQLRMPQHEQSLKRELLVQTWIK